MPSLFIPGDPCLSFEILRDGLGDNREKFPLTSYLIGGSQSEMGHLNCIMVMKMFNLHKTQKEEKEKEDNDDEEEDSSDDDEDEEEDNETNATGMGKQPKLHQTAIKHNGCVNRIKVIFFTIKIVFSSLNKPFLFIFFYRFLIVKKF